MSKLPDPLERRKAAHPIDPLFLRRWSARAMTGESISNEELMTLFEAGRWAPSTYNEQEWRFLYAHRDAADWRTFFDLLLEGNKAW
jgi:nitroreductase